MKQIVTLLLFLFAFTTSSYAVKSVVAAETTTETNLKMDYKEDGFISKAKVFVAQKVNKIKKALGADEEQDILMLILIWFVPPAAVYIYEGKEWTNRVTVNLILTLLCGLPGIIHAAWIIFGNK